MRPFFNHFRAYTLRGLLAIIPLALVIFSLYLLYVLIEVKMMGFVRQSVGVRIPGLGIIVLLVFLYFLGLIVSNVVGRQIFHLVERLAIRLPLVKTIYSAAKQVVSAFSIPDKQGFKRVVLVDPMKNGMWVIGFVTGSMEDVKHKRKVLSVFVPNTPNPTTGFLVMLKESETRDPGWTVEQALKTVIAGGIISPETIQ